MLRALIVLIMALPFTINFARYQEEMPVVYISYEIRFASANENAHEFMDALQATLASGRQPVKVIFVERGDNYPGSTVNIIFNERSPLGANWGNLSPTIIQILTNPMQQISPMLYDLSPVYLDDFIDINVEIAASQVAYALGLCDVAHNYITSIVFWLREADYYISPYIDEDYQKFVDMNCRIMHKDYEEAIDIFTQAVPSSGHSSYWLGLTSAANASWVYFQLGQKEEAFSWANHLTEFGKSLGKFMFIEALKTRAHLYALNFDYDLALKDVNTAIAEVYSLIEEPQDPWIEKLPALHTQRAQVYLLLYQWDNVLADYDRALQIDPDYADAYFYRGVLYYTVVVDRDKALPDFERYLELAPDGIHADEAEQYQADIQAQLDALNN